MFQIFGDEIYNSNEVKESFQSFKNIKIISDLSKSTLREDTLAYKGSIPLKNLDLKNYDLENIDEFENILNLTEKAIEEVILNLKIKYSSYKIRAYKYDKNTQSIIFMVCIMYIEGARKKMNDVFKRLLKNND